MRAGHGPAKRLPSTIPNPLTALYLFLLASCTVWTKEAASGQKTPYEICEHFELWIQTVPKEPLKQALAFYEMNGPKLENKRYISLADYSLPSTEKRFYRLDLETGELLAAHVSHGMGVKGPNGDYVGDEKHDGMLDRCQYQGSRKNLTRVGFFKTGPFYFSSRHDENKKKNHWPDLDIEAHGRVNGLRLTGLSESNAEALARGVVMHEATYNRGKQMGRSHGCPAFRPGVGAPIMETIAGGSLFYSYAPQCSDLSQHPLSQVPGWEDTCQKP